MPPLPVLAADALAVHVDMTLLHAAVLPPVRAELVQPLRALLGDPAAPSCTPPAACSGAGRSRPCCGGGGCSSVCSPVRVNTRAARAPLC